MGETGKREFGRAMARSFRTRVAIGLFLAPVGVLWGAAGDTTVILLFAVPLTVVLWTLGIALLYRYHMWPFEDHDSAAASPASPAEPGATPVIGASGSYPCSTCGYERGARSRKPCPSCGSAP